MRSYNIKPFIATLLLLFVLCFTTCDLFNESANPNYLDELYEELAWANAPRLNITIAHPLAWGTSALYGTGKDGSNRVGFPFDVEFTPRDEYALVEWRAYATDSLEKNWVFMLNPEGNLRGAELIEDVVFPATGINGGRGSVTVNDTRYRDITLVPYSRDQPRIVYSIPNAQTPTHESSLPITVSFASPLRQNAALSSFSANGIRIFMQSTDGSGSLVPIDGLESSKQYYSKPEYDPGLKRIIIRPFNNAGELGPPPNSLITLQLGTGILSANSNPMIPVSISWKATESDGSFSLDWWEARCADANEIIVSWEQTGGFAELQYKVNGGTPKTENIAAGNTSFSIDIAEGELTSVPHQIFDISILLNGNPMAEHIIIGNTPGMSVDKANPAKVIDDAEDLRNINMDGVNILREDIPNVSGWVPVGNASAPFTGEFYGMGKTITIASFNSPQTSYGLFGNIRNAKISNLKMAYNAGISVQLSRNASVNAGAVAGAATGLSSITGCSVTQGYKISTTAAAPNTAYMKINGQAPIQGTEYSIVSANESFLVQAVHAYLVSAYADYGAVQTLRNGIENADVDYIIFSDDAAVNTITINTSSLVITKSISIEGKGITITRSTSMNISVSSNLLRITNAGAEVNISRVHFKGGRVESNTYGSYGNYYGGAAIYNQGKLSLESCIFSGNEASAAYGYGSYGGAILCSGGTLNARGNTFYNNIASRSDSSSERRGGAIYVVNGTLNLSGNLFYGNSSNGDYGEKTVARNSGNGIVNSLGYNVFDDSSLMKSTGDKSYLALEMSTSNPQFNTTTFVPTHDALRKHIPPSWANSVSGGFPGKDFNGEQRKHTTGNNGAPGAVEGP